MQLFHWFPCVIAFWVALPFEEIFQLFVFPKSLMSPDVFDFVLCFSFDEIRWWSGEVWTM